MSELLLTHTDINGGTPVKIRANAVKISGKKNLSRTPDVNSDDQTEVQTQSFENLSYTCTGVNFTGTANTLTWNDVLTLYKLKYDGTNYATLNITYGSSDVVTGLSTSTDIQVVLDPPTVYVNTKATKDGASPMATLVFVETA